MCPVRYDLELIDGEESAAGPHLSGSFVDLNVKELNCHVE